MNLKLLLILGRLEVVTRTENVGSFDKFDKNSMILSFDKFQKIFEDYRSYFGGLPQDVFKNHEEIAACNYLMTRNKNWEELVSS